jgi:hypothetical protein
MCVMYYFNLISFKVPGFKTIKCNSKFVICQRHRRLSSAYAEATEAFLIYISFLPASHSANFVNNILVVNAVYKIIFNSK